MSDRHVVISTDCHASAKPEQFIEYVDPLQREIYRARRSDGVLTLAFVDVDGLKAINDTHGHAAGDRALRAVAAALLDGLRSYDLVVRYGGDEFLCGLPGTDLAAAQHRFDAVATTLAEQNPGTSVSIGLAELAAQDTLETLIARADAALYAARRSTRGRGEADRTPRFTKHALHPNSR